MPISILEAFAAGLPVVSTASGGIPYVVDHERTGLLSDVGDSARSLAMCAGLFADQALATRLARTLTKSRPTRGRRFAASGYGSIAPCAWTLFMPQLGLIQRAHPVDLTRCAERFQDFLARERRLARPARLRASRYGAPGMSHRAVASLAHVRRAEADGAPGRTRTCDPRLRRPMLYPTELRAHIGDCSKGRERAQRVSHANGARRRSGERESVSGSPRGEAPRRSGSASSERATASEPRERSGDRAAAPARERVGESEGRSPSEQGTAASERARERATRTERAGEAARERACRGVRGAKPLGGNGLDSGALRAGERARRASHANGARRRSGARESVSGSPRGEAPRRKKKADALSTELRARRPHCTHDLAPERRSPEYSEPRRAHEDGRTRRDDARCRSRRRGDGRGQAAAPGGGAAAAIRQVADAYVKATTSGDAKAVAALYTEDAVEMPPNLPMVKGRAAIQRSYEKVFSSGFKVVDLHAEAPRDARDRRQRLRRRHLRAGLAEPSASDAHPPTPASHTVIVRTHRRRAGRWRTPSTTAIRPPARSADAPADPSPRQTTKLL